MFMTLRGGQSNKLWCQQNKIKTSIFLILSESEMKIKRLQTCKLSLSMRWGDTFWAEKEEAIALVLVRLVDDDHEKHIFRFLFSLIAFLFSKFLRFLFINVLANLQIFSIWIFFFSAQECFVYGHKASPIIRVFVIRRVSNEAQRKQLFFPPDLKDKMRFQEKKFFHEKLKLSYATETWKIRRSRSNRSITQ